MTTETVTELTTSVFPIVLCHWMSSGDIGCYPHQSAFTGNLLKIEGSPSQPFKDRATPKPEVYKALINLLSLSGQWVLDPLSGSGEYGCIPTQFRHFFTFCLEEINA
jgi:hypothetical protein